MLIENARNALLLGSALLLVSCASPGGEVAGTGREDTALVGPRDVLTAEEIQEFQALDTHAMIRRLRSFWLKPGGTGSWAPDPSRDGTQQRIKVYIDGVLQPSGVNELKLVAVPEIRKIHRLCGREATLRFGIDHGAGAIFVTTRAVPTRTVTTR